MTARPAFWDTSALVPLCLLPRATPAHRRAARSSSMVVWWATETEARGAIQRYGRQQAAAPAEVHGALLRLERLRQSWREILPTERVRILAAVQLERFDLRAADALQLAAALVWCQDKPRGRRFLTSDHRLAAAALAAGFELTTL